MKSAFEKIAAGLIDAIALTRDEAKPARTAGSSGFAGSGGADLGANGSRSRMSKMTANAYRSRIAGSVHEMMTDAHDAGVVSTEALQSFDETCLAAATAREVKISSLRERK